jgi:beta-glucosidase
MSQKVAQETVDRRAREVLKFVQRCVRTGVTEHAPEEARDIPETAALLREVAAQSIVLLKNEGRALPFKKQSKVAVIGPNAKTAVYCGGGSAKLRPYYTVTPFEGIVSQAEDVHYALGCHAHKMLPLLGPSLRAKNGEIGVTFRAFTAPDTQVDRRAVDTLHLTDTDMYFADYYHPELTEDLWWGEIEATYTAEQTGDFEFGLCVFGTARLYVDGELVVDNETVQRSGGSFFNVGTVEETGIRRVEAGRSYHIKVVFASGAASKIKDADGVVSFGGGGVRIGGARVIDADEEIRKAVELAASVDQVVLVVGLNADFEQEGHDRSHMDLPGRSDDLVAAVAAANPRTVVVVQSGTPVSMPWASSVAAVVQAWYGGNELGNAIADVLFGNVNPSGKLPLLFPVQVEDNPAFLNYRSERGRVLYGEDVYVGYRYYEAVKKQTLWGFGWGLSYTTFALSDLVVGPDPMDDKMLLVEVDVRNTGKVNGAEVVQLYVSQRSPSIKRPVKELKGFAKVLVDAGSSAKARISVEKKYATSFWDEARHQWIEESGEYDVWAGNSSSGPFLKGSFAVESTRWWSGL